MIRHITPWESEVTLRWEAADPRQQRLEYEYDDPVDNSTALHLWKSEFEPENSTLAERESAVVGTSCRQETSDHANNKHNLLGSPVRFHCLDL